MTTVDIPIDQPVAPRADSLDRTYKILVPLLLLLILAAQLFGMFYKPAPSPDCLTAISEAQTISTKLHTQLVSSLDDYQNSVYKRADNINQQIFLANENTFLNITAVAMLQNAALKVQAYCK